MARIAGRTDGKETKARIASQTKDILISRIANDIVAGLNRRKVLMKLKDNQYDMPFKTSDYTNDSMNHLYADAINELKVECDGKKEELRNILYERYMLVYETSIESNDRTNALNALKEVAKMLGLNEPEQVNVNEKQTIVIDFGFKRDDEEEDEVENNDKEEVTDNGSNSEV